MDDLQEDTQDAKDIEELKSKRLKNMSLSLLSISSPSGALDLFERDCVKKSQLEGQKIFVEELCTILFFFMTLLREMPEA